MNPEPGEYLKPASRPQEILAGIPILGAAAFLGYFGIRGAVMYLHGSRVAPADPVACAIGILAGIGGCYFGLRLLTGWHQQEASLPNMFLFLAGLGSLAGGIWFITINRSLNGSPLDDIQTGYLFGLVGVLTLVLWWRRFRKRIRDS